MIDTNDSEFLSRIESADLKAKICDAKTAAAMIQAFQSQQKERRSPQNKCTLQAQSTT